MQVAGESIAANVHRLQPLRVLLSGRDRRFIRVTSFLLARRGYDVAQTELGDTIDAAERHRADVVLLETDGSRSDVARKVAALQALAKAPGVLLLLDESEGARWADLPTIAKWSSLDALAAGIEAASLNRSGDGRPAA